MNGVTTRHTTSSLLVVMTISLHSEVVLENLLTDSQDQRRAAALPMQGHSHGKP